jgi:hypothetical protein
MKYYCEKCQSEYNFGETVNIIKSCVNCSHVDDEVCEQPCVPLTCYACYTKLTKIPDYETPQQYEKRTGKLISSDTAVWFRIPNNPGDSFHNWTLLIYVDAKLYECSYKGVDEKLIVQAVIADPPVPPPDDWRPE